MSARMKERVSDRERVIAREGVRVRKKRRRKRR